MDIVQVQVRVTDFGSLGEEKSRHADRIGSILQVAKSAANTAPKKVRDSSATPLSPRISTPHSSSPGSGPQNSCLCNHRNPHPHLIAPTVQPHLAGGMSTRVSMPNNTSSPPIAEVCTVAWRLF